ncbi:MAG: hypothetical protein V4588_05750, partial [Pseudomonadota bacterium]
SLTALAHRLGYFDQAAFNRLFEAMVASSRRADWSRHGIAYAQTLMRANDGSAEALILSELAMNKSELAMNKSVATHKKEGVQG